MDLETEKTPPQWAQTPKSTDEQTQGPIYRVRSDEGDLQEYREISAIAQDIIRGKLCADNQVCIVHPAQNETDDNEPEWSSVREFADSFFDLQVLYRPIWAHTIRGFWYGCAGGILIAALGTAGNLARIDGGLAALWILFFVAFAAGLFDGRLAIGVIAVAVISLKEKILMALDMLPALFGMLFGVAVVGVAFGGAIGMIIASIVGHVRNDSLANAADFIEEPGRPYIKGVLLPTLWVALLTPLYAFWFVPWATNSLFGPQETDVVESMALPTSQQSRTAPTAVDDSDDIDLSQLPKAERYCRWQSEQSFEDCMQQKDH